MFLVPQSEKCDSFTHLLRTSFKTVSIVKELFRNSVKVNKKNCCWMMTASSRRIKRLKVPAKVTTKACSRTKENQSGIDKTWTKSK